MMVFQSARQIYITGDMSYLVIGGVTFSRSQAGRLLRLLRQSGVTPRVPWGLWTMESGPGNREPRTDGGEDSHHIIFLG